MCISSILAYLTRIHIAEYKPYRANTTFTFHNWHKLQVVCKWHIKCWFRNMISSDMYQFCTMLTTVDVFIASCNSKSRIIKVIWGKLCKKLLKIHLWERLYDYANCIHSGCLRLKCIGRLNNCYAKETILCTYH